jgi:ribosomal-protein-alanine N-acetyltransferase
MSIRKAKPEDANVVRRIALSSRIDSWTAEQYRDETGRSDAVILVAHIGSEIVGFISGRVVPSSTEGLDGEIYNIAVEPGSRGKGIGRVLLEDAIKSFAYDACREVWLEVRESNRHAIQFYENNGFKPVTVRRNFYNSPGEDAIVMKLTLISNP